MSDPTDAELRVSDMLDTSRAACEARRAAFVARCAARGEDGEAILARAAVNVAYWRAHPAPWDNDFVMPCEEEG